MSLLDVGMAALKATPDPKNKTSLIQVVPKLSVDTMYGRVAWGKGPVPNVVTTPIIGGQWIAAPPESPFNLDFVVCENVNDPKVPVAAKLQRYDTQSGAAPAA